MPSNVTVGQKSINKIHCKVKRIWNQLVVFRNLEEISRSEEFYSIFLEIILGLCSKISRKAMCRNVQYHVQ